QAGGRNTEGAGIAAPEERRRLIPAGDIDHVARHQRDVAETPFVPRQAVLVVAASLDEVERDLWQPLLRQLAQILDIDRFLDPHLRSSDPFRTFCCAYRRQPRGA